ncbi:MAG: putative TIM-barrel fold metal-dependent hydrolase [Limisphaerales bacterium]|jgi:predicted TIM-barrel fold metal-dependent hydrolase
MPHIEGRTVHDADAHIMETPDWLRPFAEAKFLDEIQHQFDKVFFGARKDQFSTVIAQHGDADFVAGNESEFMARKNHMALGSFRKQDRPQALDLLGVQSQLIFPTTSNVLIEKIEFTDNIDLVYAMARASNRAQVDFCSVDDRLLPVCNVPLASLEQAPIIAKEAIELGAAALLIPWACPKHHATSHVDLDRVWALAQEAKIPILFHVGAADFVLPKAHANNGHPAIPDFHGGDENFRSISYMAIPGGPQQALSMMILDGVLDRFPTLMFGVIELGAIWVPGFIRQLDAAMEAFGRHEERLQSLQLRPSEYVSRQVRVTPYPTEDAGWIINNAGADICMFSSDFPHVEGGRNPYGRFQKSTEGLNEPTLDAFYRGNFEQMMGLQTSQR